VLAAAVVAVVTLIAVAVALPFLLHGGSVASVREDTTERDDSRSFAQTQMTNAEPAPRVTMREGPKEDTSKKETPAATQREPRDTGREVVKPNPPKTPLEEGVLYRLPPENSIYQVAFAADTSRAAGSTKNDGLFWCDLTVPRPDGKEPTHWKPLEYWVGKNVEPPREPVPAVTGLAITRDGKWIYYGTRTLKPSEPAPRSVLCLWDTNSTGEIGFWPVTHIKDITCIYLCETAGMAITGTAMKNNDTKVTKRSSVLVWTLKGRTAELTDSFDGLKGANVLTVAVSSDGKRAASSGDSETGLLLWDVDPSHKSREVTNDAEQVRCIAFSPNGHQLAYAGGPAFDSQEHPLHLIDAETGTEVGIFKTRDEKSKKAVFHAVGFSADGKWIIAGNDRGEVHLWDVSTREELSGWQHKGGTVIAVALSPDRKYAYSAARGGDNAIRRWHTPEAAKSTPAP
jgi:WD40 repeat protein